jgi:hypothetical protein
MSTYGVNKACWMLEQDEAYREAMRTEPDAALKRFNLEPDEVRAIREGDVVALFQHGAHPFLLQWLAHHRVCGLDVKTYRERITSLAPQG